MKICIIANGYPDKREPQWGCFERDQANALKNAGHQVSILYVDRRFRTYWRKIGISCYYKEGLSIYGIFLFPGILIQKILLERIYRKIIGKLYDKLFSTYVRYEGKPDVIYAHYIWNIYYVSIIKVKYNVPIVGIEHWSGLTNASLDPKVYSMGEIAYANVNQLLAVSQSLQSHIYRHFKMESTVVYDMLGQEFVHPKVLKREKDTGFKFIAVGSLLPIKCYDIIINAFAKSGLNNLGCLLSIVGDGPEKSVLEQIVKELKLENSVVLHGHKTKQEIIQLLSESHVFVLSSKAETFGVACIEALSQGLPAIATKCGGPEEIIDKTNGILVETGNVNAMAEAMCQMYENYGKYDGSMIADDCISRFSPEVIANQLSEIFNKVTE